MFDQTSGSDRVFDMLKLKKTDTYYVIKYVVLIENAEVLLQTLHLPVKLFPKLTIQDVESNNLPQLLSSRYQHTIHQVKNGFSPVNLSSSEALLLNTFKHAAAHRVRTTIMDQSERPIAYLETLFLGQFTQFEVLLG